MGAVLTRNEKLLLLGAGTVALFLLPKLAGAASHAIAKTVAESAGNVIIDGATGAVIGIGKSVGIPETDPQQCQRDIAAGDMWNASFNCPASVYLKALWGML